MEERETNLIRLILARQDQEMQQVKKLLSGFSKYFFNIRRNICIVYDRSILHFIQADAIKIADLGKAHIITDLAYNYERGIVAFMTVEGALELHFIASKTQIVVKKDAKKIMLFDWVYSAQTIFNFFTADEGGVRLYRLQEDRRGIKEVKHISGRYNCFLYEPIGQVLVMFPAGDCKTLQTYVFELGRVKSWFKGVEVPIDFSNDESLVAKTKKNKSLGLQGSRSNREIFSKLRNEEHFIQVLRIHRTVYLVFYFSEEGKLKLIPLSEGDIRKQVQIKLPSDALPSFNIVDNMLVTHLRNEKITFVYDVCMDSAQMLVSPFPLTHQPSEGFPLVLNPDEIYQIQFVGKRAIWPSGRISKWRIDLPVIYSYLKNELQVFDFLNRRTNSKILLLNWLRENLFKIKQINLSRMWKSLFLKNRSNMHDESDIVSTLQLYTNIFYTLSLQPLISKEALLNVLLECMRQAFEFQIKVQKELQELAINLLLATRRYELLAYLCNHDVFVVKNQTIADIFSHAEKENEPVLLTLVLDLANQMNPCLDVFMFLMKTQRVREAKRYLKANHERIAVPETMKAATLIKDEFMRKEYIKFVKFFIPQKFPTMSLTYLEQSEKQLE